MCVNTLGRPCAFAHPPTHFSHVHRVFPTQTHRSHIPCQYHPVCLWVVEPRVLHGRPWGFFQQPTPIPVRTHTCAYGYRFWWVQVWVCNGLTGLVGTHETVNGGHWRYTKTVIICIVADKKGCIYSVLPQCSYKQQDKTTRQDNNITGCTTIQCAYDESEWVDNLTTVLWVYEDQQCSYYDPITSPTTQLQWVDAHAFTWCCPIHSQGGLVPMDVGQNCHSPDVAVLHKSMLAPAAKAQQCTCWFRRKMIANVR